MSKAPQIPVCLFAYARPAHLARVLGCLRENHVPLLYIFSDFQKDERSAVGVAETRSLIKQIDWCDVRIVERDDNFGLAGNILDGVTRVAREHDAFIVWEDDLICVKGTYAWLCGALIAYGSALNVGSVTAWTHPSVTPADINGAPYLDGRAECWVWGSWARAWRGMQDQTASDKMRCAEARGISRNAYGSDLPAMAHDEQRKRIWAVRWLYHHLMNGLLCVRPPWSMVEHIGFDETATNAVQTGEWTSTPFREPPPLPRAWPEPRENIECGWRWREAARAPTIMKRIWRRLKRAIHR